MMDVLKKALETGERLSVMGDSDCSHPLGRSRYIILGGEADVNGNYINGDGDIIARMSDAEGQEQWANLFVSNTNNLLDLLLLSEFGSRQA